MSKYGDGVVEGEEWGSDEVDNEGKVVGKEGGRMEGQMERSDLRKREERQTDREK